jgi:DNA-binding transcriptional MerR regulator/mannose-6-phosphate isomerase-like protein (cupin superfamily)
MARLAEGERSIPAAALGAVGIEEAARIVGASPSALRLWEHQGLVSPTRTVGGARRYRADDIERLRRVRSWRTVEGLNAAAIRRLLEPVSVAGAGGRHRTMASGAGGAADGGRTVADASTAGETGAQLRAIRRERGLSLREAARGSGLSTSFISSLERGVSGASIATLRRLLDAYGRTVGDLVHGAAPTGSRVVRPADRRVLDAGRGIRIEDLFASVSALESQLFVLAPGASSDGFYRHAGEEFMYVLAGTLGVWLDDPHEFYRLEPGDALTFPSTHDHRIQALGQVETRVLWVNTPPTF